MDRMFLMISIGTLAVVVIVLALLALNMQFHWVTLP